LIKKIENKRESKVIAYYTGDRHPFGARIAEDAVRPLYEHLMNLDFATKTKRIDLILYSRGGDVSVPWRITNMIREFCDEFCVLVPYKAQSAATLISLGADGIVMGRKAELGPIDPTLVKTTVGEAFFPQEISVEDVNSYLSFVRERAGITDQSSLGPLVRSLVDQITPLTVGAVNRQNSHIRLVARKLLTSRREKMDEERINAIIETLTEKVYSHGHAISRREAADMGLPVHFPDEELEDLLWQLHLRYERFLKLDQPLHPELELGAEEERILDSVSLALIESYMKLHVFEASIALRKNRKIPTSPQLNLSFNLQLPAGIRPEEIPREAQQILQQLISQLTRLLPRLIQQEIVRQSPIVGFGGRVFGGMWNEKR